MEPKRVILAEPGPGGGAWSVALGTRGQTDIKNQTCRRDLKPSLTVMRLEREWERRYQRRTPHTSGYNCFGHAFAGRRTAIYEISLIETILVEDEYVKIDYPSAGDVVIYRDPDTRDIEHAGIVVGHDSGKIEILSKFNDVTGEFIHEHDDDDLPFFRPFPRTLIEFWSDRRGADTEDNSRNWRSVVGP
jgi:hypothetical protein